MLNISRLFKFPMIYQKRCIHASSLDNKLETLALRAAHGKMRELSTTASEYTVYGWDMSYFSGKVVSYFQFKQIPFRKHYVSLLDFNTVQKKVGYTVMPVVVSPDGEWIQDSRNIINKVEELYPTPSVFPSTPNKRFISCLLEAWGDEFWIPFAMHYRWSFPESSNEDFFRTEAGRHLLPYPFVPDFVKKYAAGKPVKTLREFLPVIGVIPSQHTIIESWTQNMLTLLENHFRSHQYLLGGSSPTIGDFGMVGPLIPHLARDPYPKETLLNKESHPNIHKWINRMTCVDKEELDTKPIFSDNDVIPKTLEPILAHIFNEFIPMMQEMIPPLRTLKENKKFYTPHSPNGVEENSVNKTLPRMLSSIEFPIKGQGDTYTTYKKATLTFNLYKMQLVLDEYKKMDASEQKSVKDYLTNFSKNRPQYTGVDGHDEFRTNKDHGKEILEMDIPRLDRVNVRVKFV